jgi:hypothetical protein
MEPEWLKKPLNTGFISNQDIFLLCARIVLISYHLRVFEVIFSAQASNFFRLLSIWDSPAWATILSSKGWVRQMFTML